MDLLFQPILGGVAVLLGLVGYAAYGKGILEGKVMKISDIRYRGFQRSILILNIKKNLSYLQTKRALR